MAWKSWTHEHDMTHKTNVCAGQTHKHFTQILHVAILLHHHIYCTPRKGSFNDTYLQLTHTNIYPLSQKNTWFQPHLWSQPFCNYAGSEQEVSVGFQLSWSLQRFTVYLSFLSSTAVWYNSCEWMFPQDGIYSASYFASICSSNLD